VAYGRQLALAWAAWGRGDWLERAQQVGVDDLASLKVPRWLVQLVTDEDRLRPLAILVGDMASHPLVPQGKRVAGCATELDGDDVICLDRSLGRRQLAEPLAHELAHLQHPDVHAISTLVEHDAHERFARRLAKMMFVHQPRRARDLSKLSGLALRLQNS
jgi:hypothetical protein